ARLRGDCAGPRGDRARLSGARRLGNESFFSAPQLKRDPLGAHGYSFPCFRFVAAAAVPSIQAFPLYGGQTRRSVCAWCPVMSGPTVSPFHTMTVSSTARRISCEDVSICRFAAQTSPFGGSSGPSL